MITPMPSDRILHVCVRVRQLLSHSYIVPSDRVLMLGGNIGGTCVAVDKALRGNGHQQACVEPNPDLHETLDLNRRSNNASWNVVQGVIANSSLTLHAGRRLDIEVPHICLEALEEQMFGAGKHFTFLHADCEGCVCVFLKENPCATPRPPPRPPQIPALTPLTRVQANYPQPAWCYCRARCQQ